MYAVINSGGKQQRVFPGEEVKIEKVQGSVGDAVTFDQVLVAYDGETVKIGRPYVENGRVLGTITRQGKAGKSWCSSTRNEKAFAARKVTGSSSLLSRSKTSSRKYRNGFRPGGPMTRRNVQWHTRKQAAALAMDGTVPVNDTE